MYLLALLFFMQSVAARDNSPQAIDDIGAVVRLAQPARRIVSLSPHVTELLFEVGAGKRVVGAVSYSDYPPAAKTIPGVGSASHLDLEKILALQPDLVVAWHSGNSLQDMQAIQQMGIPVFYSEPRRVQDIPRNLEELGMLTGNIRIARSRAAAFRKHYESLHKQFSKGKKIRVFFQLWHQPLMTVNGEHLISDLIALCGGTNVFGKTRSLTPVIGWEAVVNAAPEVVLATDVDRSDLVDRWRTVPAIPAMVSDTFYVLSADLLHRQGPRILQGAEQVCHSLQDARLKIRDTGN
jgi:iron complex transport system substrate-binding protein